MNETDTLTFALLDEESEGPDVHDGPDAPRHAATAGGAAQHAFTGPIVAAPPSGQAGRSGGDATRIDALQRAARSPMVRRLGLCVVAAAGAVVVPAATTHRVEAWERCAIARFGRVVGVAGPGLYLQIPLADSFHCLRTSTVFYEALDDESRSLADFTSGPLDGVTKDGQPVSITYSARYRIDPDEVSTVYRRVGTNMREVQERVAKFHVRTVTRQIVQRHSSADLYSGDLGAISRRVRSELSPRFRQAGVVLEYFEIKRPRFSEEYEQAIEAKQIALERVIATQHGVELAEQEARRQAVLSRTEAEARDARASSQARALSVLGAAVRDHPEVTTPGYAQALGATWNALERSTPLLSSPSASLSPNPDPTSATAPPPAFGPPPTATGPFPAAPAQPASP